MAPMLFARAILAGEPIKVFNHGKMQRDFTYIDDIVEGLMRCCDKPATSNSKFDSCNPDPSTGSAPYRIFNIGNNQPVELLRFIEVMEKAFGCEAIKDFQPINRATLCQLLQTRICLVIGLIFPHQPPSRRASTAFLVGIFVTMVLQSNHLTYM